MGFFRKFQRSPLDVQLELIQRNLENNYKDEAKSALKEAVRLLDEMTKSGELSGRQLDIKRAEVNRYVEKMKGYGHNIPVGW